MNHEQCTACLALRCDARPSYRLGPQALLHPGRLVELGGEPGAVLATQVEGLDPRFQVAALLLCLAAGAFHAGAGTSSDSRPGPASELNRWRRLARNCLGAVGQ